MTTELLIANGRIGLDAQIGDYTYIGENGRSVVDDLLLSRDYFDHIVNFSVCDPTEFSDHCALLFKINCQNMNEHNYDYENTTETSTNKILWQAERTQDFRQTLISHLDMYNEMLSDFDTANPIDSLDTVVNSFSNLLFNNAFDHFGKTHTHGKTRNPSSRPNQFNEWYNNDCKSAKQDFINATRSYKQNKSHENKTNFVRCRSKLNKVKRRAKATYQFEQGQRVSKLAKENPKQFWKSIKKGNKSRAPVSDKLSTDDFFEHFSEMYKSADDINISDSNASNENINIINDLDLEITPDEVMKVIKSLKTQKSPGLDGLVSEIFKSSADILCPILVKIFNVVFSSECYPKSWSEGVITPIHKKGNLDDVNNYRGITLINIMSKIYSHILHSRLIKWADEYEKINNCQFGFQPNKSTVDCIFLFHSIISKTLSRGEKLYCSFVDFRRAFDTINRNHLWQKLIQINVSSKMIRCLRSMYDNVKAYVKYKHKISPSFPSQIGLKQGDPLSALLFTFFINDLVQKVSTDDDQNSFSLQDVNLFMLLYADDVVLFGKTPELLQHMLNNLSEYSAVWDLHVNTDKTKIMIFENGEKTIKIFTYGDIPLENVEYFKYLGITFFKNGNWNRTQKYIADHGSYALHNLYKILSNIRLNIPEKFKLFDSLVSSVLSYSSEIWGYHIGPEIERIHTRFCRYILGVQRSTNLSGLYSELGRKPLIIFRQLRMIKYWLKLRESNDPLLKSMFNMLTNDLNDGQTYGGLNWAFQVKKILDSLGLSHLWRLEPETEISYEAIKMRIFDQYNQTLTMEINNSSRLRLYSKYKENNEQETYLNLIKNKTYMQTLSRFRLSSHQLEIETGRHIGSDRDQRLCRKCNMRMIEDEYHFLLTCPLYNDLRTKYFSRYFCHWPNMTKFKLLMSSKSKYTLLKLSKYIYFAQKRRNETANVT